MTRLTQGWKVIRFIEEYCVFVSGAWQGKPVKLMKWQKRLLLDLFEIDPATALRKFLMALIGTPKKNGKSELAAMLALYMLLGDGEIDPLVVVAAAGEDQADLVFGAARQMCQLSPKLAEVTDVYDKEIISKLPTGGKMKRVAAAVGTNDGANISALILDELHEWQGQRGRAVWTVLTNGTVSRRQPLIIQITTAGYDKDSICYELYERGLKKQSGETLDPRFFFRWFGANDDAPNFDYKDVKNWIEANPSFGVTITQSRLEDELHNKPENTFKRYYLNIWTENETAWLPNGAWDKLTNSKLELDPALPTWAAIDAATKNDSTAVVTGQWQGEKLAVKCRIWERPIDPTSGKPKQDWRMPMAELEDYLRGIHTTYGPNLQAMAFDPAFITWLAQSLEADGLPMEEFPQSPARMSDASQKLYELIVQGKLEHDGNPAFKRHIKNAAAEQTGSGNGAWRLVKRKAKRKMDAVIALAMCTALASKKEEAPQAQNKPPNVWFFDDDSLNDTGDENE